MNVDHLNQGELRKLDGKTYRFVMAERGPDTLVAALKRGCLSPERLELKEGAAIMFTKNNPGEGFVNGTLGRVIGFEGLKKTPIVRTQEGARIVVEPMEWMLMEGDTILAKITQLPLRLAWALTIHKSQGVSLDAAVMDLSQTFEFGQGYVALSRVRRLSGLYLLGLNERALQVHPAVLIEDRNFRAASLAAEAWLAGLKAEDKKALEKNFLISCGGKLRSSKSSEVSAKKNARASVSPIERIRQSHGQAYRPWTSEEEEQLTRLFNRGGPLAQIATTLGRQPGSIRSRLKKLGLKEV